MTESRTMARAGRWAGRLAGGCLLVTAAGAGGMAPPDGGDREARIRADYESAVAAGSVAALRLFIQHNTDHPLADSARRRIEECFTAGGQAIRPCPVGPPRN